MTVVLPNSYLSTPVVTPIKGTLLDTATVSEGLGWMDTEAISLSFNCLTTNSLTVWPDCNPTAAKTFNNPSYQDGFRFVAYAGVGCKSIGFDREDAMQNALRVFLAKESVAVEQALMAQRFIASAGNWPAPTDITPASGAVKPSVGLALLEQDAGINYAGVPTVHAPRAIGSLLTFSNSLHFVGDALFSAMGSKVAAGAGYAIANQSPAGVAAPAGELWVYATGEVSIARGEVIPRWELDRTTNDVSILVERPYIAVVDCYAAAIRVKVE